MESCRKISYLPVYEDGTLMEDWRSFSWLGAYDFEHVYEDAKVVWAQIRPWGALSLRYKEDSPTILGGGSLAFRAKGNGTVKVGFEAPEADEPFFSNPTTLEIDTIWKDYAVSVPIIPTLKDLNATGWKLFNVQASDTPAELYIELILLTERAWDSNCLGHVSLSDFVQTGTRWVSSAGVFQGVDEQPSMERTEGRIGFFTP